MTTASAFVPADLDAAAWSRLEPFYKSLLAREVGSREEFDAWNADRSELDAAASEARANLYIRMTCFTDDESASSAWTRYLEEVSPKLKPMAFALDRKYAELADRFAPSDTDRYAVLTRDTRNQVELFREQNVPLETEIAKLDQEYDRVCGTMTVDFEGEERTLPQMARFLQKTDRSVRESAWRAVAERRLAERETIDGIFDRMLELRHEVAQNAGFDNFRDFQHRNLGRFDYTPDDCARFHEGVEKHAVPFLRRLDARRKANLGVDPLRPWDLACDEKGREPLEPFESGTELVDKTRDVFRALDPELAGLFETLGTNASAEQIDRGACLDLDSRKGKASGGYQYMRDRSRKPFIFMNAAGLHRDVETMIHEAGHAFHSLLCRDEPLLAYRHSMIEFAEVASMAQELLTMPHWDAFYPDPADADRARRQQLEGSIALLPWVATIDAFQHWLYTNPGHSRADRTAHWNSLLQRFGNDVSWEGLDDARDAQWQRQGHLFGVPFYYIEYGIAQLGALGVYQIALEQGRDVALDNYKRALALGGSRPLPELFQAAGVPFDLSPDRIGSLVGTVEGRLAELPE